MNAEEWAKLGLLGNNVAMQWYVLAHPDAQLPVPPSVLEVPGGRISFNSNLLVLGVLGIGLFFLLSK